MSNRALFVSKVREFLSKEGVSPDLVDVNALYDSGISFTENINNIRELCHINKGSNEGVVFRELSNLPADINSIIRLFGKPAIIGVVADVNQGKSMLLYHLIHSLRVKYSFKLFTYGLRVRLPNAQPVFSVSEIEGVRDSVIVIDELSSLFDLDNRKIKKTIENALRLINHNNNVLVLAGVPENFKKFLSAKINYFLFKRVTLADLINGSRLKNLVLSYSGYERGSELLDLPIDRALLFDGSHFSTLSVPYYEVFDSKRANKGILCLKK